MARRSRRFRFGEADTYEWKLESTGSRLSDYRRVAATFRNIAEHREAAANTAVVWTDGDNFTFMGTEAPRGYANFSFLHETGFEDRVPCCSVRDCN